MGSIWGRQDPGGPHDGPMNFAIWDMKKNRKTSVNKMLKDLNIYVIFQILSWNKYFDLPTQIYIPDMNDKVNLIKHLIHYLYDNFYRFYVTWWQIINPGASYQFALDKLLTHCGQDKMDAISQMTASNTFWILNKISLMYVSHGLIDNMAVMV